MFYHALHSTLVQAITFQEEKLKPLFPLRHFLSFFEEGEPDRMNVSASFPTNEFFPGCSPVFDGRVPPLSNSSLYTWFF